jgi:AcrR family transcriptional regulator
MARPKVHDASTAEQLLEAATTLLRDAGPDAVSVRAVAEACGCSVRAVYALFGSKQALVDALAERGYLTLADRVDAVPHEGDAPTELVAAGADAFRSFALDDPQVFRLTFEQVSADVLEQHRVRVAARRAYASLQARVAAAREAGGIHASRTDEDCVFAFHSLCQGLASGELAARPVPEGPGFWPMMRDTDFHAVWRHSIGALVRGFAEPAGELVGY